MNYDQFLARCEAERARMEAADRANSDSELAGNEPTTPRAPGAVERERVSDTRSRERKIAILAAALALPPGMADQAVTTGMTAEAFALHGADYAAAARAAAAHEADIDAVVARITGSAEIARPAPLRALRTEYPAPTEANGGSAEAVAARIIAA